MAAIAEGAGVAKPVLYDCFPGGKQELWFALLEREEELFVEVFRAVMTGENNLFCEHHGFDLQAMRLAWQNNQRGGRTLGGSTITMQTAKNLFLWPGRSLVRKGFEVFGYDVDSDAAKKAASHGVRVCGSVAEVGKHAEVVMVMVATDKQIHDVVERSGLLDNLARGSVLCIASSCSPETCRELAALAAPKGIGVVDVPLVLGQEAMNNGEVVAYVGGDDAAVARRSPRRDRRSPPSASKCFMSAMSAPARSPRASTICSFGPAWSPISSASPLRRSSASTSRA